MAAKQRLRTIRWRRAQEKFFFLAARRKPNGFLWFRFRLDLAFATDVLPAYSNSINIFFILSSSRLDQLRRDPYASDLARAYLRPNPGTVRRLKQLVQSDRRRKRLKMRIFPFGFYYDALDADFGFLSLQTVGSCVSQRWDLARFSIRRTKIVVLFLAR